MNTVFNSSGLALDGADFPALSIAAGETAGWRADTHEDCHRLLDLATGLADARAGGIVWFDQDIAALREKEVLRLLGRVMPMTPDGGLVSNVNTGENILLPFLWRNPERLEEGASRLQHLLESEPWREWFPVKKLCELPHQLTPLARALAAVLRAWVVQPEAIIACDMRHALEARASSHVSRALVWLREALPDAAWLVLQTESALPAGIHGNILPPQS